MSPSVLPYAASRSARSVSSATTITFGALTGLRHARRLSANRGTTRSIASWSPCRGPAASRLAIEPDLRPAESIEGPTLLGRGFGLRLGLLRRRLFLGRGLGHRRFGLLLRDGLFLGGDGRHRRFLLG